MRKPLDFSISEQKALVNRIMEGKMVLFLGSEFSLGAVGNYQNKETGYFSPVPGVSVLKQILTNIWMRRNEASR